MIDVEPKTPNKRKNSFGNKNSAKKPHVNANTPQKNQKGNEKQGKRNTPFNNKKSPKSQPNTPQQLKANTTPQNLKTPKAENELNGNAQKQNKKTPITKVKPFAGTANLQSPKVAKEKFDTENATSAGSFKAKKIGKNANSISDVQAGVGKASKKLNKQNKVESKDSSSSDTKEGKKRRAVYSSLKEKVREGDTEALTSIQEKIKAFMDRQKTGELSKTAKRKLNILERLQRSLEEKVDPEKAKQKKNVVGVKEASKPGQNQGTESKKQKNKQQNKNAINKKPKLMVEEDSDEDELEEGESEEDESGEEEEEESDAEVEAEDSEGSNEEDEEDDDEEESDDDSPPPPSKKEVTIKTNKLKNTVKDSNLPKNEIKIDDLKKKDLLPPKQTVKNKTRYVVFVGNIPYDTKKEDIIEHFKKCGEIRHIRIPTEKKGDKPRGFCYVEVADEESYQKCLSKHHSSLNGRRINVLYTHGGKKKGENEKKIVKAKNLKLQALRKEGKLSGSIKENQRRAFRRKKQKQISGQTDEFQ